MNGHRGLWVVLLGCVVPLGATATETNYQDFLIGQRAMGMGGAFAALADDPSASWYNPAGLGLMPRSSGAASISLYGVERRTISGGFGNPLRVSDLAQTAFPIIPTTFSVTARFGEENEKHLPRNAVGLSLFLPNSQTISYRGLERSGMDAATFSLSESDRTLWAGPSFARRIGDRFALGFSLFYDNHAYSRSTEYSNYLLVGQTRQPCPGTPTVCSLATNIDQGTGSLFLRVGALWLVDDRWRLGVAFSTPTFQIHGGASVFTRQLSATGSQVGYTVDALEDQSASYRRPFELRIGTAYTEPEHYALSVDLTIYGPVTYNRVQTAIRLADPLFVQEVHREPTINLNFGAELFPKPYLPVRLGAYTNFSSAPELPERTSDPHLTRVHMFGGSVSFGYLRDGYGIDIGVTAAFGWGVTQSIDPEDPTQLRRASTQHTVIYVFLSGIGQALARNVRKILDKFKGL